MERRRHLRYDLGLSISWTWHGRRLASLTEELSLGGARLLANAEVPVGEVVELHLVLPEPWSATLVVKAQVRWVQLGRMGVQFKGMAPADQRLLAECLSAT